MNKLPDFFEYQLKHPMEDPFDLFPFSYDEASLAFRIGSLTINAHEFDPYTFNPVMLGIKGNGIELNQLPEHSVILPGFGSPIAGPKTHDWARNNHERLPEVAGVMHAVYASFYEHPEAIRPGGSGHMGFHAGLQNEEGGVHLQVLGDCACSGPNLYGLYVQGMEHGFAEYDLHNADTQAQRVSLYAGLGHIARLAEEA